MTSRVRSTRLLATRLVVAGWGEGENRRIGAAPGTPVRPSEGAADRRPPSAPARRLAALLVVGIALCTPGVAFGASAPPALAGSVANAGPLSGATSTAIAGRYAYVPGYSSGIVAAVDLLDPGHPIVAGTSAFASSLLNASNITIANGFAYVVSKNRNGPSGSNSNDDGTGNSLTILDITTDPTHPAIVGSVHDAVRLFGSYGVAVQGQYAYVAAQGCLSMQPCPNTNVGDAFTVVDISNPAAPTVVATVKNNSLPAPWTGSGALKHPTSVAISGHYAFVTASYANRLTVLDIANPLAPVIVASPQDASKLNFDVDVTLANGYAYVADQAQGVGRVAVVDVHDAVNPEIVSVVTNTNLLNGAYRIKALGKFVYVAATYAAAVAAVDVSDPLAPRVAGSYKSAPLLNRAPGLDVDPAGVYLVAVSPFLSTESQPTFPPYPFDPGGPTLTGTVAVVALDPAPASVTIAAASKPANPTSQTTANFTFTTANAVATVQCQLDNQPTGPCTSATTQAYASLGLGQHTFTVRATDAAGFVSTDSYTWTIVVPVPPTAPVLDSFNRADGPVGANWSIVFGGFTNFVVSSNQAADPSATTFAWSYWQGQQFGPDSSTFATLTSASADAVRVCARFTSPSTAARSGYCVQETAGSWAIRRIDSGSTIALGSGFTQAAPVGSRVGIVVVGSRIEAWYAPPGGEWTFLSRQIDSTYPGPGYLAIESRGAQLDDVGGGTIGGVAPQNTVLPSLSGVVVQGQSLAADPGSWSGSPAPSFGYQWQRCDASGQGCADIASATNASYLLVGADVGGTVRVVVTGSNSAGQASAASAVSAVVAAAPQNTVLPSVSGVVVQGQSLAADPGSW